MDEDTDTWPLLQVSQFGAWIAAQPYLWQMGLLTATELERKTGTFGLGLLFSDRDIFRLWRLGLLRADLIYTSNRQQRVGLVYRGKDIYGRHLYSDERVMWTRKSGIVGAAAHSKAESATMSPHFHPFRYLILYHLERALTSKLAPSVVLSGKQHVRWLYEFELKMLRHWSTSPQFKLAITRWDSVASLVIALEPWYSAHFSDRLSVPSYLLTEDDVGTDRTVHAEHAFARLRQDIESHWDERMAPILRSIGKERLERIHSDLCVDADLLDRNGAIHLLLMLQPAPKRLETDGRLGGALYIKTMAEILRHGTEAALGVQLREEDECGVHVVPGDLKRQRYGADRILDGDTNVARSYIRDLGWRPGIYLRWYVEGTTEWGAVNSILGHQGVDVVNLRGKVAEGKDELIFLDSLDADAQNGVFSFVSIDDDRKERKIALRTAAQRGRFFGCFFISDPDFEFGNFDLWELEEILWKIAMDTKREMAEMSENLLMTPSEVTNDPFQFSSASDDAEADRALLHECIAGASTGKQLVSLARGALSKYLGHLSKNEAWGVELMRYAMEHPTWRSGATRPIVEAVHMALRARDGNYTIHRNRLRVDPVTGRLIEREA